MQQQGLIVVEAVDAVVVVAEEVEAVKAVEDVATAAEQASSLQLESQWVAQGASHVVILHILLMLVLTVTLNGNF